MDLQLATNRLFRLRSSYHDLGRQFKPTQSEVGEILLPGQDLHLNVEAFSLALKSFNKHIIEEQGLFLLLTPSELWVGDLNLAPYVLIPTAIFTLG